MLILEGFDPLDLRVKKEPSFRLALEDSSLFLVVGIYPLKKMNPSRFRHLNKVYFLIFINASMWPVLRY